MAVHFSYRALGYEIGDAVTEALSDGRIAGIFEAYGLTHAPPQW